MQGSGPAEDARSRTFDRLLDRAALDRAYRTARLILLDPAEAEDATQDAVLNAWRRFAELRDAERFEAWFGRILVNACRDRIRARRRGPISLGWTDPSILGRAPGRDIADAAADSDLLRSAFRTLSPEHREVIALRFFADLTVEQIADRTATRVGTVKSRLHYALRHLRATVGTDDAGRSLP